MRTHVNRAAFRRISRLALSLGVLGTVAMAATGAAVGAKPEKPGPAPEPGLAPAEILYAAKSKTGRLAQTDPTLLGLSSSDPVNVVVKYDYDPVASYGGGVAGLAPTSPAVTGKKLKNNPGAVKAYESYLAQQESDITAAIQARVSGVAVGQSLRTAYGGVAMQVPGNKVSDLLKVDGVAAVQRDALAQPLTDASPAFIGATAAWGSLGGPNKAGEGVIVGVLDTGVWPEHPSYNDPGISHPGGTYGCEFGDGSDPALGPPFTCNDKLIGAYAKTATYMRFIGAVPGEFCNNTTKECSARDSEGHGTHTSSTAAGSPVPSAVLFGIERGPVSGIAPGAHVIMYRVCLEQGCFGSDSVSAVEQAITDGADVLNFSISGGASAYTDPVELAFLDAYAAGILVNASAGNAGPGAGTANHAGPWTNTVGASTSNRHFVGTLTITADNGDTFTMPGATITSGISTPTPVILGSEIAGQPDDMCRRAGEPGVNFPAGSATGKIVVCRRQLGARVNKSFNVFNAGGVGMILYNGLAFLGVNTDNHWVPSIHLEHNGPAGTTHPLITFLSSHTGELASFTTGVKTAVRGDVMTSFSSRGPLGDFIKPDVTSVGIQVLAGHSPQHVSPVGGPPGELFQAIAGTSMSSPHSAGAAALVKAAHPDWTPGQIKSSLMTASVQDVLKEDGVTPATPFDRGAGSVRPNRSLNPTVTFDETAEAYAASARDSLGRIHLNLASINAPTMPGVIETDRTFRNVSGVTQKFSISTIAPAGATIDVKPSNPEVAAGATQKIKVTIDATALAVGQYFGQITLDPVAAGNNVVIPVAFFKRQGAITLDHTCNPTTFPSGTSTSCQVKAQNMAEITANAEIDVKGTNGIEFRNGSFTTTGAGSSGHLTSNRNGLMWRGTLSAAIPPSVEAINAGAPVTYTALSTAPVAGVGDETIVNFNVPAFRYGFETYTRVGLVSNGYAVVGGGAAADVDFVPQTFPDPDRPNNVLAPFWTDLDPTQGGEVRAALASVGGVSYIVLEWRDVAVFSAPGEKQSFQLWIRTGATEGIHFAYGTIVGSGDPAGLNVGAENRSGTSGKNLGAVPASGDEYTVVTGPPTPGGLVTINYKAFARSAGVFDVIATLTSNITPGETTKVVRLTGT
jgi:subtilisin family serine protease